MVPQASEALHNPFNPGLVTAIKAAPLPVASPVLSQCQVLAALYDPFMHLKLYHLGDSSHQVGLAA